MVAQALNSSSWFHKKVYQCVCEVSQQASACVCAARACECSKNGNVSTVAAWRHAVVAKHRGVLSHERRYTLCVQNSSEQKASGNSQAADGQRHETPFYASGAKKLWACKKVGHPLARRQTCQVCRAPENGSICRFSQGVESKQRGSNKRDGQSHLQDRNAARHGAAGHGGSLRRAGGEHAVRVHRGASDG